MSIISKSKLSEFRNQQRYVNENLRSFSAESKIGKTSVFLSHKHDELKELDGAISFLKKQGVSVYIDWLDDGMPKLTSGVTAQRIKNKIKENSKFILLATEAAINSKWCNWELGYGDYCKYINNIAILPVKDDYSNFSGSEYLQIYPRIEYVDYMSVQKRNGGYFEAGYYVIAPADNEGFSTYVKLHEWLSS